MSVPTDFGPDSGGRIKVIYQQVPNPLGPSDVLQNSYKPVFLHFQGLTIVKPIIYGNVARYFGKKREEDGHTHQWTVYVKPYANEDMSAYIKKVNFKLHESYANPNRILTKPPYELTETGWGEFEIVIKLHFHDPNERPVTLYHILKLFQSPVTEGAPPTVGRTLVSESYEEIVFQEPTQLMQHLLHNVKPVTNGKWSHDTDSIN
ncbi:YEATS domain containing protein 4 [Operophtera brumata]|uniref:YEATS domain-containing protein 4 n=1 Tax=Operophtera brumata TaxID=104452 RepID=A0A0L7LCJ9_OPEBR|nr:YEATS domain containing protein 4 [Operophtera brumata]